ncbi:recombinase family protein [Methylobacterium sp. J-030]|uniref:recombinase family protein n=1 Tax=Methylobacterium sp. J-030 TaxID=2836627 RepID=UPI001FBA3C95|nr:recombinase family protein [Methylobacterium sp. J-030]MCJ2070505.1 recombinase family protein [Methylobacterium sp. J-030]
MSTSSARARLALRRNAVQAAEREEVRALTCGYLRVSTDEQAQRGNSLPEQEQVIRAYATAVGLDLVQVLADPGVSGTVKPAERPGFSRVPARPPGRAVRSDDPARHGDEGSPRRLHALLHARRGPTTSTTRRRFARSRSR